MKSLDRLSNRVLQKLLDAFLEHRVVRKVFIHLIDEAGGPHYRGKYNAACEAPNCRLSGKPLLKKREKWRTPSYFGRC